MILSVLQTFAFIMVLKLHKLLSKEADECLSISNDETKSYYDDDKMTIQNQDAVAFEPSLFTTLMLEMGH